MKKFRLFLFVITIVILTVNYMMPTGAAGNAERFCENRSGVMSISHRGDTSKYPSGSLKAVLAAYELGADAVSVAVAETKDGVPVLCENKALDNIGNAPDKNIADISYAQLQNYRLYDKHGNLSDEPFSSLAELLEATGDDQLLVLDTDFSAADKIYDLLKEHGALKRVAIRTEEKSDRLCEWIASKPEKPLVIGIYSGNVIFSVKSHIAALSAAGMPAVQYQSKNYFNVMFGAYAASDYSAGSMARAVAAAYDPDLSGQRSDSESGWDDLIDRGFSVIETNNIGAFAEYIRQSVSIADEVASLSAEAGKLDWQRYSSASAGQLKQAVSDAESVLAKGNYSLDALQKCRSQLVFAAKNLAFKNTDDTVRGALSVTPGKIAAALIVGAVLLAAQIYVHKMQKEKNR